MDETAPTWSTTRELVSVVGAPQHVKRTVVVTLVVGTAFFAMNQLGVILAGRGTALVWAKAALTYLTPLLVSNLGVLSATRRSAVHPAPTGGCVGTAVVSRRRMPTGSFEGNTHQQAIGS